MSQPNIEKFNTIAGLVLANLYDAYPEPTRLDTYNYIVNLDEPDCPVTAWAKRSREKRFIAESIERLKEAGLLNASAISENYFYNAVLTVKGLECLKKVPDNLKPNVGKTFTEHLKNVGAEGSKIIFNQLITFALTFTLNS
ncbi:hypothetical protein QNN88_01860 [Citrobacter sp. ANG330]|uniref:hypothetical protein n=1 Tax=Citrobacter sp. ANG330 TaxID=3048142 RepID=UPI0039C35283